MIQTLCLFRRDREAAPSKHLRRPRFLRTGAALLAAALAVLLLFAGCATGSGRLVVAPQGGGAVGSAGATGSAGAAGSTATVASLASGLNLERYRTGKPDTRAEQQGASVKTAASGAGGPEAAARGVAIALASRENDPFMKVKLIHDWVCLNISYDAAMLASKQVVGQDIASVWNSRKAVCSGYSRLFQTMAEAAGIPCAVVSGFAKNQGGMRGLSEENSHAWNIVKVGQASYIVDATFDAGYVENGRFIKRYSTDDLFVAPAASIFTRFPKEERHQLLQKPVSAAGFLASPDMEGAYFALGLRAPGGLAWKNEAQGRYALDIDAASPALILDAAVYGPDGSEIPQASLLQRGSASGWTLLIAMRDIGVHKVELYAARAGGSANAGAAGGAGGTPDTLRKVMTFLADNKASSDIAGFPRVYARYQRSAEDSLIEPLSGALRRGAAASFAYRAPSAPAAMIFAAGRQFPMTKGSDGVFRLSLVLPAGADEVKLALSEGGDTYGVAIAWTAR
jgi:hypothetical protein